MFSFGLRSRMNSISKIKGQGSRVPISCSSSGCLPTAEDVLGNALVEIAAGVINILCIAQMTFKLFTAQSNSIRAEVVLFYFFT